MFDISWTEFLLIGIVALIAIGPKELPGVLRTAGQYMGKVRRMAAEFQGQFQEAMREAEMTDLKKEVDAIKDSASGFVSGFNPMTAVENAMDPVAPSDAIPAGPPPPLVETHADGTVPAPAEQQALPPPEASPPAPPPPPAAAPATVDLNIPIPEAPPPVTEKDFATASAAPAASAPAAPPPKAGEGGA